MWCLGIWFSHGLGSIRFTVGLADLKGSFQPKQIYDSKSKATSPWVLWLVATPWRNFAQKASALSFVA